MICKKCSANIPDDAIFCSVCGVRADGNRTCPKCENLIDADSIFCIYCGQRIDGNKTCPSCQSLVPENAVFCSNCRTRLDGKEVCINCGESFLGKYCPYCGTEKTVLSPPPLVKESPLEEEPKNDKETIIETPVAKSEVKQTETQTSELIKEEHVETSKETLGPTQLNGSHGPINVSYYALPIQIDEKTFYVECLKKIALDKNSPEDIFTVGVFSSVKMDYRQYVLSQGDADMTYAALVGYDYEVKYTEYKNGQSYERKKTETKWEPFSGSFKKTLTDCSLNDSKQSYPYDTFIYKRFDAKHAISMENVSFKTPAPIPPTDSTLQIIQKSLYTSALEYCKLELPGDHKKDFHCNGHVKLTDVACHVAPQYTLEYKYKGKTFTLWGHASKEKQCQGDIPSAKSDIASEIENNPSVTTFNFLTSALLILSIVMSFVASVPWIIVCGVLGIVSFIISCVVRSRASASIYARRSYVKKLAFKNHLKSKGITPPAIL